MNLSPPSQVTFILSVLLAVLALLVRFADAAIPVVSGHSFETMLVAFLLLLAGVLFRGSRRLCRERRRRPLCFGGILCMRN